MADVTHRYSADARFRDAFLALAKQVADRQLIGRHYLHLGERQRRTYFADGEKIPLKKIFYALRPAAALRWLRLHEAEAIAPMHFPTLMEECDASRDVRAIVDDLIVQKSVTRELGYDYLPAVIGTFIDAEFEAAASLFGKAKGRVRQVNRDAADRFFRSVIASSGD